MTLTAPKWSGLVTEAFYYKANQQETNTDLLKAVFFKRFKLRNFDISMARAMTFENLIFCVSYKYFKHKYLSIQQLIYLAKLRKNHVSS
jgi:hypothetical protein